MREEFANSLTFRYPPGHTGNNNNTHKLVNLKVPHSRAARSLALALTINEAINCSGHGRLRVSTILWWPHGSCGLDYEH
jgi:hypothetical protein